MGLETVFEALQARFTELDDQMASAAQVATRIGDRLQVRRLPCRAVCRCGPCSPSWLQPAL